MKPARAAGGRTRLSVIASVIVLAALDVVLIGMALVHGHPDVHGTPQPIATYSSPASPVAPSGASSSAPTIVTR